MLSPTESIPARPARPTICLYWLLFRKSVATYGERRMTLNQGHQREKNKHVFGHIDLDFTFWEFHRLNEVFHEINTGVVLKDELSVTIKILKSFSLMNRKININ